MMRLHFSILCTLIAVSYLSTGICRAQTCPSSTPTGYCVIGVPSVKGLQGGNWSSYQYVQTLGYYAAGDAGGNTIYQKSSTSSDPDNGGSIIVDSAGTRFIATAPSTLNILQWGATGSSTTTTVSTLLAGSSSLQVSAAQDFQVGEKIAVSGAGTMATVPPHPVLGSVVTVGNVANFTATSSGTSLAVSNVTGTTGSFTGTAVLGSDHQITVASVTGVIAPGALISGTGIPSPTYIQYQLTGRSGSAGRYLTTSAVSPAGGTISFTNQGVIRIGETLTGPSCVGSGVTIKGNPSPGTYTTSATTTCTNASVTATDQANTYCVQLVALDSNQGFSAASTLTCGAVYGTLDRPRDLVQPEYIVIPWAANTTPGTAAVAVYAGPQTSSPQAPLTCRFVQDINFADFRNDYGQPAECPAWLPPTAPTAAQADILRTTITNISGTTFSLADANLSGSKLTSGTVAHDDTGSIQNALNIQTVVTAPCGTFNIFAPLLMTTASGQSLTGGGPSCTIFHIAGVYDGLTLETPGASFNATASGTTLTVSTTGFNGRINVGGASFTGSQTSNTLTVANAGFAGNINIGAMISGAGLPAGEGIVNQLSGAAGGPGTYTVSATLMSPVSAVPATAGGGANSGDTLSGAGIPPGTVIVKQLTGNHPGADGTYLTSNPTTVSGTSVVTTGSNVSSATFTGSVDSSGNLTVSSIIGYINTNDSVTPPKSCGSFIIRSQTSGLLGSNGVYTTSAVGSCGSAAMSSAGRGIQSFRSSFLQNMTIDGSDQAANFCLVLNNLNRAVVQNIILNECYDEVEITNSYVGTATNIFSDTIRRGDYGWWLWGTGVGGGPQTGLFDLTDINLATAYQGISWYEDGNVASIRARHLGMQESPVLFVADNAIASTQTPTYAYLYDMGLNACWFTCMYLQYSTGYQFYAPYIQGNAGGNADAVVLGQRSVGTQIFGGIIVNGYDSIDDAGVATQIHASLIYGADDASIECEPGTFGEGVYGGSDFNVQAGTPTSLSPYGVKLDSTGGSTPTFCANAHIGGAWLGQISNVYDLAPPTSGNTIEGLTVGSPTPFVVTGIGDQTLLASSYNGLYTATGGLVATLEAKTNIAASHTYTLDTAAAIIASLNAKGSGVSGVQFRIKFNSHSVNKIILSGGTGVTLVGTCTIPPAVAAGGSNYLNTIGTVTSSSGVTLQCL